MSGEANRRLLIANAGAVAVRVISSGGLSILLPLLLARVMPHDTYPVWALAFSLAAYVTYLDVGVPTSLQKLVARAIADDSPRSAGSALSAGLKVTLGICAVAILVAAAAAYELHSIAPDIPRRLIDPGRFALVSLTVGQCANLLGVTLAAYHAGLQRSGVPSSVIAPSQVASLVGAVVCAIVTHSLIFAACGYTLPLLVGVVVLLANVRRDLQTAFRNQAGAAVRYTPWMVIRHSGPIALWSICTLLALGSGSVIVGHFAYRDIVAYSLASVVISASGGLAVAVMGPLLPEFVRTDRHDPEAMGPKIVTASRINSGVLYVAGSVVVVLLPWWPGVLVGARYADNYRCWLTITVMVVASSLHWAGGPLSAAFIATENHRRIIVPPVLQAVVTVIGALLLVRPLGSVGVSAAMAVGAVLALALLVNAVVTPVSFIQSHGASIFWKGIATPTLGLAPAVCATVAILQFRLEKTFYSVPIAAVGLGLALLWTWFVTLPRSERVRSTQHLRAVFAAHGRDCR